MKSEMPCINEMTDLYTMKMIQVSMDIGPDIKELGYCPTFIKNLDTGEYLNMHVYKLVREETRGNVPRKVWWDSHDQEWKAVFYSTQAVEIEDRQIKNNFCCFMCCDSTHSPNIGYHIDTNMLIDQLKGPDDRMYYVFMFSESSLADIVDSE